MSSLLIFTLSIRNPLGGLREAGSGSDALSGRSAKILRFTYHEAFKAAADVIRLYMNTSCISWNHQTTQVRSRKGINTINLPRLTDGKGIGHNSRQTGPRPFPGAHVPGTTSRDEAGPVPRGQLIVLSPNVTEFAFCENFLTQMALLKPDVCLTFTHVMSERQVGQKSKIRSPMANVPKASKSTDVEMKDVAASESGSQKPKTNSKPKPGDEKWEEFRSKRNKKRAERKRLAKKKGKKSPYALYIDATGVNREGQEMKVPISLTEWRILLQQAMVTAMDDLCNMQASGITSPGEKLALAHHCFVERNNEPDGKPTSNKSPDTRFGHGAMFFDHQEAEIFM